ncbi:hypothetical protein AB0465_37475 [Streptomyces griseoviridis]|uniref:hypothetical protein n=1 Tax=Streptomyces griseoviridis TaxID=45398 RepID=UPI00344F42F8
MSNIDVLLAHSRLSDNPQIPSDVVPYDDLDHIQLTEAELADSYGGRTADDGAAQRLNALCEAVVAHCTAEQLTDFLTDQVPQPRAAWILGCVLQLAGAGDSARFWWQYAGGADDAPASYCLYLQHLACGDPHAAALWQAQADAGLPRESAAAPRTGGADGPSRRALTADASLSTVLRVLSRLTPAAPRHQPDTARTVIDFVATAVAIGYDRHPDLEIPVPGKDFAEQLEAIAAGRSPIRRRAERVTLPNRPAADPESALAGVRRRRALGPDRLLVNVTGDSGRKPVSRQVVFFKDAAAVCWEAATAVGNAVSHGRGMAYYVNRYRPRATAVPSPAPSGFGTRPSPATTAPARRGSRP